MLFALSHQLGFQRVDPRWNAAAVVQSMQTTHFNIGTFSRSYWMFFSGFGYFVTALLAFSAVLCWALSSAASHLRGLLLIPWSLAVCYSTIAIMTWRYFFLAPGIFATIVAAVLVYAAIGAGRVMDS